MFEPHPCRLDGDASVEDIVAEIICRMIYQMPNYDLPLVAEWITGSAALLVSRQGLCAMARQLPEADQLDLLDELLRHATGRLH